MDLRMKCRQNCLSPGRRWAQQKRKCGGGRPAVGRPPPHHFLFCRGHPLPFPLHFCLHFKRRSMGNLYYFLMLMPMKMLMLMLNVFNCWFICCFFHDWQMLTYFLIVLCVFCIVVFVLSVLVMSGKFGNFCVILDFSWATHESVASFIPATVSQPILSWSRRVWYEQCFLHSSTSWRS